MAEVKLRALGLREVDFGDFDRYLTALTEQERAARKKAKSGGTAAVLLGVHSVGQRRQVHPAGRRPGTLVFRAGRRY